jgi:hypothetical protein
MFDFVAEHAASARIKTSPAFVTFTSGMMSPARINAVLLATA